MLGDADRTALTQHYDLDHAYWTTNSRDVSALKYLDHQMATWNVRCLHRSDKDR